MKSLSAKALALCAVAVGVISSVRADGYSDTFITTSDSSVTRIETETAMTYVFTDTAASHTVQVNTDLPLIDVLIVGGGGAGGFCDNGRRGAGGGGGGVIYRTVYGPVSTTLVRELSVGVGGKSANDFYGIGGPGVASSFTLDDGLVTAYGGSGGGSCQNGKPSAEGDFGSASGASATANTYGAYTEGQGNRGGLSYSMTVGGGGGGACEPGQDGSSANVGGKGGDGFRSMITGVARYYGSGGGGGGSTSSGAGGRESGGAGGSVAESGVVGLGGGGGGDAANGGTGGGKGGSGTVILRFAKTASKLLKADALPRASYPYSGKAYCPEPVVRDVASGEVLAKGEHYTLSYADNDAVGTATITVIGVGDYEGASDSMAFDLVEGYYDDHVVTYDKTVEIIETDTSVLYVFTNSAFAPYFRIRSELPLVDVLLVGGGGAGGYSRGGGGGGGGVVRELVRRTFTDADELSIAVGAGGSGATTHYQYGADGGHSSLGLGDLVFTAFGGSGGCGVTAPSPKTTGDFGSAGGSANNQNYKTDYGAFTAGQGHPGGTCLGWGTAGGGGGGAGENGGNAQPGVVGGKGGDGRRLFFTGKWACYGAGGGGGGTVGGAGGAGGGGAGGSSGEVGYDAVGGFGGGGGGGDNGKAGGKSSGGVVMLRFPKTAASIIADPVEDEFNYDGAAHPARVDVRYPADVTLRWSTSGEEGTFTLEEAPSYTDEGSQDVWCRITADGFDPLVVKSSVTVIAPEISNQSLWFVKPDGDPAADGTTWEKATTLSNACALVTAGSAATAIAPTTYHEIILRAGTVEKPTVYDLSALGPNPNDAESVLCLPVGYIILRSEDAACDPRKVVVKGGYDAQKLRMLKVQGVLQVKGITFEDFYTTSTGGVLDNPDNKSLTVSQCAFRHNYAKTAGGAVRLTQADNSMTGKALDCTFVSNRCATARGGSAVRGGLVTNCCFRAQAGDWATTYGQVFRSDYIENLGGVFYCCNATDCEIISNRYYDAVGYTCASTIMSDFSPSGVKMLRCHAFANRATEMTTGAMIFGLTYADTCEDCTFDSDVSDNVGHSCTLKNCTFTGYTNGVIAKAATITGCTFTNNFTQIFNGGTIKKSLVVGNIASDKNLYSCPASVASTVTDCLFASNTYAVIVNPHIAGAGNACFFNCTFADNTVGTAVITCGWDDNNWPKLVNCLLYGNSGYDFKTSKSNLAVSNSLYQTVSGGFDATLSGGNSVATRLPFRRKIDILHPYGYCPTPRSEARDAGLDVGRGGEGDMDLTAVTPRVIGNAVDIGCYEYEPSEEGLLLMVK